MTPSAAFRCPPERPRRVARGVTLVELVIGLVILALLCAIALPEYGAWLADSRVDNEARALAGAMQVARSEAIKRGHRVNVCKSADLVTCASVGSWAAGFVVHRDVDRDGDVDAGEAPLHVDGPAPRGVTVRANAPLDRYVSYTPFGHARLLNGALQMGTMRVCAPGRREVHVVLANSGRVRISRSAIVCP
jgi:type IV fimbrial biogenesis protein FimT